MLSSLVIDRIMLAFHNHREERDRVLERTTSIIVLAIHNFTMVNPFLGLGGCTKVYYDTTAATNM